MANFLVTTIRRYSGLSTETKPTLAAGDDVLNGSRFLEIDTEKIYYFNASDDTWYEVNSRSALLDSDGNDISVQYPLPTDSDSVYVKDLDIANCDNGDFSGVITDYFDSLKTVQSNSTSDNPKIVKLWFKRTVYSHAIGFGCDNLAKGFGNSITIKLLGSGEAVRYTKTFSPSDPNSFLAEFGPKAFNGLLLEFNTANEVCLSNITIGKSVETTSTLQALKPNGDVTNIDATSGGNLKVSVEEIESGISSNNNSQLNVTQFDSTGNEVGMAVNTDEDTNIDGEIGLVTLSGIYGRIDSDNFKPANMDASTHGLISISYEHHEIHSGGHYNYCDYALSQGLGAIIEFIMITPNTTEWVHLTFSVSSSTGATIELYEGASGITAGTPITPRNNNRNSANVSGITLLKDPSAITSDGTRASGYVIGGNRSAGIVDRQKEIILAQNQTYLVRITSLAASNNIAWCAEWYEHTDKD